jgi:PIN domain nuclease of toxin-antitoxin system
VKLLLDTHVLLWSVLDPTKMSPRGRQLLDDEANESLVGVASLWEIAIKVSLGKIVVHGGSFENTIQAGLADTAATVLPIELDHLARLVTLPHHHRDPFDRLLVAQTLAEGAILLSADAGLDAYGVTRAW